VPCARHHCIVHQTSVYRSPGTTVLASLYRTAAIQYHTPDISVSYTTHHCCFTRCHLIIQTRPLHTTLHKIHVIRHKSFFHRHSPLNTNTTLHNIQWTMTPLFLVSKHTASYTRHHNITHQTSLYHEATNTTPLSAGPLSSTKPSSLTRHCTAITSLHHLTPFTPVSSHLVHSHWTNFRYHAPNTTTLFIHHTRPYRSPNITVPCTSDTITVAYTRHHCMIHQTPGSKIETGLATERTLSCRGAGEGAAWAGLPPVFHGASYSVSCMRMMQWWWCMIQWCLVYDLMMSGVWYSGVWCMIQRSSPLSWCMIQWCLVYDTAVFSTIMVMSYIRIKECRYHTAACMYHTPVSYSSIRYDTSVSYTTQNVSFPLPWNTPTRASNGLPAWLMQRITARCSYIASEMSRCMIHYCLVYDTVMSGARHCCLVHVWCTYTRVWLWTSDLWCMTRSCLVYDTDVSCMTWPCLVYDTGVYGVWCAGMIRWFRCKLDVLWYGDVCCCVNSDVWWCSTTQECVMTHYCLAHGTEVCLLLCTCWLAHCTVCGQHTHWYQPCLCVVWCMIQRCLVYDTVQHLIWIHAVPIQYRHYFPCIYQESGCIKYRLAPHSGPGNNALSLWCHTPNFSASYAKLHGIIHQNHCIMHQTSLYHTPDISV